MKSLRSMCLALVAAYLSGTVLAQTVTLSPANLAFGNEVLNTPTAARQVTLKNGSSTPLTITGIFTNLADFTQTNSCPISPATLRAGGSCLILVTFTPSILGSQTASLTVTDDAANSPQTVHLSGSGVVAVSVTPAKLSFPNQVVGTSSTPLVATVHNNQTSPITISGISTNLSDFQETTTCPLNPATLAAGGSCTVSVVFTPSVQGNRIGTLSITDGASNTPQTVSLSGKGTAVALLSISVTPNPASIALGSSQQFTATGTYNNGTTQNLTSSAIWTSSAPLVATVGVGGACS